MLVIYFIPRFYIPYVVFGLFLNCLYSFSVVIFSLYIFSFIIVDCLVGLCLFSTWSGNEWLVTGLGVWSW